MNTGLVKVDVLLFRQVHRGWRSWTYNGRTQGCEHHGVGKYISVAGKAVSDAYRRINAVAEKLRG